MAKRRKKSPPHRFGVFNVRRVRVRNWDLPRNVDDAVAWSIQGNDGDTRPPDIEMGRRRRR